MQEKIKDLNIIMIYHGFAMLLLISVSYQRQFDNVPTGDPPKLKPGSKRIYQFRPGENLKLICPIENVKGQSKGGFLWKYRDKTQLVDIESYDETIKVKGPKLIIKNATESEEGEYQCEGINGFGKAVFRLYVFITNGTNKKKDVFSPKFIQKRPELDRIVKKGQDVKFFCGYKSNPPPTLEWYHNDTRLLEKRDKKFLTIESVDYEDSGSYRCEVGNVLGVVKRVWSLKIGRKEHTNLIRNEFKYENSKRSLIVNRFQDARLNCKIRLRNSANDDKKVIIRVKEDDNIFLF
ncbi:DgyrCDS10159 [Dimorphilus gyrociliatus]|uniref:DgyrCDS10159 n=1 Tax=Dimorphilus gyrociliatus TaxID=2664684 RepID=A0A7I8VZE3_9ANNE|nr:DgyrCDS10159 [Dimorphilus gyrociliatus]